MILINSGAEYSEMLARDMFFTRTRNTDGFNGYFRYARVIGCMLTTEGWKPVLFSNEYYQERLNEDKAEAAIVAREKAAIEEYISA